MSEEIKSRYDIFTGELAKECKKRKFLLLQRLMLRAIANAPLIYGGRVS